MVISTYSKSKHYNPVEPEADLTGVERDEVGLVRAICVKVQVDYSYSFSITLTLVFCRLVLQQNGNNFLLTFKNEED